MGLEQPGQPTSSQTPPATSGRESPDNQKSEASCGARKVSRPDNGSEQPEPLDTIALPQTTIDTKSVRQYVPTTDASHALPVLAYSTDDKEFMAQQTAFFEATGEQTTGEDFVDRLHFAAEHGLICSLQFLLRLGDRHQLLAVTDKDQNNLFHLVAKGGHTELLRWLIGQSDSMALSAQNCRQYTPLHYAFVQGHTECVKLLLDCDQDSVHANGEKEQDEQVNSAVHWAAQAGMQDVLQLLVERGHPDVLLAPGKSGTTPLHCAVLNEHLECVRYIVETSPDAMKEVDKFGATPIHQAAREGKTEILQYLVSQADVEVLHIQDQDGNTALHGAAAEGHEEAADILLHASEQIVDIKNHQAARAVHTAAVQGRLSVLKKIVQRKPDSILVPGKFGMTALHFAADRGHIECVRWLLSDAHMRKNLTRIVPFNNVITTDRECQLLLAQARRAAAEPRIEWPPAVRSGQQANPTRIANEWPRTPHHREQKRDLALASEWPVFPEQQELLSSRFSDQAREVLNGLGRAGIYLSNRFYPNETEDKFYSIGDLNVGVQMAKILQDMGLEFLEVVLSPPDSSLKHRRMGFDEQRKEKYNYQQRVARHKLALLWPGIDPEKPLPQTLKQGSCQVTFRDCDDPSELPQVMFSFRNANGQLKETGTLAEVMITLKPYRFYSGFRQITADIREGRGNVLPLILPPNSVIPQVQGSQPGSRLSALSSPAASLGELVQYLGRQSRSGKTELSVVYGLHHPGVSNLAGIMTTWVRSMKIYARSMPVKKPAIIAVSSNVRLEGWLPEFVGSMKLPLIDLGAITRANVNDKEGVACALQDEIDNLPPGRLAICILPSLPKPQFESLVLSSRLPALVEGANLTSFLLQHGRPHLSLLPSGETPVAQDMGDPLESIKAEAFSWKLGIDKQERKFLARLTLLLEKGHSGAYQRVLRQIDRLDKKEFPGLAFLCQASEKDSFLDLEQLSIRKLLEKGSKQDALGEAGRKALLAALDPSPQAFMQFVGDAMNEESPTAMHFKLQQMHLDSPSVNAINSALIQLGKYKGVIP